MYIKTVTVRKKIKGKRAKKVYRYVRVVDRRYDPKSWKQKEYVVCTIGELSKVRASRHTLMRGISYLKAD